ncbi:GNAT family N-acetyltransferase [Vallitaleaceae bacterium 9-2]
MENPNVIRIEKVIDFIEEHLDNKLDLETLATASHYSKYHLHRKFTDTVGMTIHDYVSRRQLTEAAKLLVFSERPIIDIALCCGYESQQSFSKVFKAMYKVTPAKYRQSQEFYPLQLRFYLNKAMANRTFSKEDIRLAKASDIFEWMEFIHLIIDGYPHLDERQYLQQLQAHIQKEQALVLESQKRIIGCMLFSYDGGCIEFMGIHPQYRGSGLQKLFLDTLMDEFLPGREITTTTFREHDKADTGYRKELKQLGFAERELLVEFGYPTQRFVLPPKT